MFSREFPKKRLTQASEGLRNKCSAHHIRQILPHVLKKISQRYGDRPDLVLAAWPEVIGPNLASMTQAVEFREGVLIVKVKNSTLYSLLNQNDKPRLIQSLREKFPNTKIKTIFFRLG
ncbi:MAG: DUF721 domain-containing protein [Chlamydiales bacterium]